MVETKKPRLVRLSVSASGVRTEYRTIEKETDKMFLLSHEDRWGERKEKRVRKDKVLGKAVSIITYGVPVHAYYREGDEQGKAEALQAMLSHMDAHNARAKYTYTTTQGALKALKTFIRYEADRKG